MTILKEFITQLEERIKDFQQQLKSLRNDSVKKNIIISNLLAITRQGMMDARETSDVTDYNNGVPFIIKIKTNARKNKV